MATISGLITTAYGGGGGTTGSPTDWTLHSYIVLNNVASPTITFEVGATAGTPTGDLPSGDLYVFVSVTSDFAVQIPFAQIYDFTNMGPTSAAIPVSTVNLFSVSVPVDSNVYIVAETFTYSGSSASVSITMSAEQGTASTGVNGSLAITSGSTATTQLPATVPLLSSGTVVLRAPSSNPGNVFWGYSASVSDAPATSNPASIIVPGGAASLNMVDPSTVYFNADSSGNVLYFEVA